MGRFGRYQILMKEVILLVLHEVASPERRAELTRLLHLSNELNHALGAAQLTNVADGVEAGRRDGLLVGVPVTLAPFGECWPLAKKPPESGHQVLGLKPTISILETIYARRWKCPGSLRKRAMLGDDGTQGVP
jgi:hypothetical protein